MSGYYTRSIKECAMAMTDQRPRETHLATTRYVNTSRTATGAIRRPP